MAAAKTPTLVRARTAFHGEDGLFVQAGTILYDDDPIVVAYSSMFEPVTPDR